MKLTIRPLTPDLWPSLEDLFGQNGLQRLLVHGFRIASACRKRLREENRAAFLRS